jgi:hypothetical protein
VGAGTGTGIGSALVQPHADDDDLWAAYVISQLRHLGAEIEALRARLDRLEVSRHGYPVDGRDGEEYTVN